MQPQRVEDGEHLVELHRLLAILQCVDNPFRHAGVVGDLLLPQVQLAAASTNPAGQPVPTCGQRPRAALLHALRAISHDHAARIFPRAT